MFFRCLQKAEEVQREQEHSSLLFALGKKAYERGQYMASSELLYKALEEADGPYSKLAGDIQLWLGLAYQVLINISARTGAPADGCCLLCIQHCT